MKLKEIVRRYESIVHASLYQGLSLFAARDDLNALEREVDKAQSNHKLVLADLTEPNQVAIWTCGDGARTSVGSMTDSHLYYALAKAGRGEYPDSASRNTGVRALKIEAFRRLRNELIK